MTICETLHSISTKNHGRRVYVQKSQFPHQCACASAPQVTAYIDAPIPRSIPNFLFKINRVRTVAPNEPTDRHYPFFPSLLRSPRRPSNKGTKLPISDNLAPETVSPAAPRDPPVRVRPPAGGLYFICERTDEGREENTRGSGKGGIPPRPGNG